MSIQNRLVLPTIKKVVDQGTTNFIKSESLVENSKRKELELLPLPKLLEDTIETVNSAREAIQDVLTQAEIDLNQQGFQDYVDLVKSAYWDPSSLLTNPSRPPGIFDLDLTKLKIAEREVYKKGSAGAPFFQTLFTYFTNAGGLQYLTDALWKPVGEQTNALIAGTKEPLYKYLLTQFQEQANMYVRNARFLGNLRGPTDIPFSLYTDPILSTVPFNSQGGYEQENIDRVNRQLTGTSTLLKSNQSVLLSSWEAISQNLRQLTTSFEHTAVSYCTNSLALLITDITDDVEDTLELFVGLNLGSFSDTIISTLRPQLEVGSKHVFGQIQSYVDYLEEIKHQQDEQLVAMSNNRLNYIQSLKFETALSRLNEEITSKLS